MPCVISKRTSMLMDYTPPCITSNIGTSVTFFIGVSLLLESDTSLDNSHQCALCFFEGPATGGAEGTGAGAAALTGQACVFFTGFSTMCALPFLAACINSLTGEGADIGNVSTSAAGADGLSGSCRAALQKVSIDWYCATKCTCTVGVTAAHHGTSLCSTFLSSKQLGNGMSPPCPAGMVATDIGGEVHCIKMRIPCRILCCNLVTDICNSFLCKDIPMGFLLLMGTCLPLVCHNLDNKVNTRYLKLSRFWIHVQCISQGNECLNHHVMDVMF
jgi:hypothetical protein